jgi:hypothetical protein
MQASTKRRFTLAVESKGWPIKNKYDTILIGKYSKTKYQPVIFDDNRKGRVFS